MIQNMVKYKRFKFFVAPKRKVLLMGISIYFRLGPFFPKRYADDYVSIGMLKTFGWGSGRADYLDILEKRQKYIAI